MIPGNDLNETADLLLSRLEDRNEVAYAEVGSVQCDMTDIVLTQKGPRSQNELNETGIWCRVFSHGAADYRYTTQGNVCLDDIVDRAVLACKHLGQSEPARYDAGTIHRAIHSGWARPEERLAEIEPSEKASIIRAACDETFDKFDLKRYRIEYHDEQLNTMVLTSTGSVVKNALDRARLDLTIVPTHGTKIRDQIGRTTGTRLLDSVPDLFEPIAKKVQRSIETKEGNIEPTDHSIVVLGPQAAGQLFHLVSHYFEMDTVYLGAAPFSIGDKIAQDFISIADTIHPGVWSAHAYDAEARPTQPVQLIDKGIATNFIHDIASAIEEETIPHGNVIPSVGFDGPPRIHARHLEVNSGTVPKSDLLATADIYIERFVKCQHSNQATQTKRASWMPPSVLYAKDIKKHTPSNFDEVSDQLLKFSAQECYNIKDGKLATSLPWINLNLSLEELKSISAIGTERETLIGICEKHRSRIPYAVTSPAIQLETEITMR